MKLGSIEDRQRAEYLPLIENFLHQVKDLDVTGLPEPHIPAIGEFYENFRYKIAFCGMETYGWGALSDLLNKEPYKVIAETNESINSLEYLNWRKNDHATFWGFVLRFLSEFYRLPFNELADGKHSDILKSFVWANSNAIERFEVTAEKAGANREIWNKVKEASLVFDNLNHVINVAKPNIVFMLYSGIPDKFFMDLNKGYMGLQFSDKQTYFKQQNLELKYRYYYRRDSNTHIFCLPHPTYMGLYSGKSIMEYIHSVIKDIHTYHIWSFMPEDLEKDQWLKPIEEIDKSTMDYKRKFIASLANFLIDNNSVMSGQELQNLLNRNNIKTSYGQEYSDAGGRGIHKLISQVWDYYYSNNEFQTSYNIARVFVDKNGNYAYD